MPCAERAAGPALQALPSIDEEESRLSSGAKWAIVLVLLGLALAPAVAALLLLARRVLRRRPPAPPALDLPGGWACALQLGRARWGAEVQRSIAHLPAPCRSLSLGHKLESSVSAMTRSFRGGKGPALVSEAQLRQLVSACRCTSRAAPAGLPPGSSNGR